MIKKLRLFLHIGGIIPKNETDKKTQTQKVIFKAISVICLIMYTITTFGDLFLQARTLEEISQNCSLNIPGWQAYLKTLFIYVHMKKIKPILDGMEEVTLSPSNQKLAKKTFYIRTFLTMSTVTFYIIASALITKNGLPYKAWFPHNNRSSIPVFWMTWFILAMSILSAGFTSVSVENFLSINLIYLAERIQQLQQNVKDLDKYTDPKKIREEFGKCIVTHQKIFSIGDDMFTIIGIMSGIHFICLTFSISLTGISIVSEINQGNFNKLGSHVLLLLTVSIIGGTNFYLSDNVASESVKLYDLFYNCNWMDWPTDMKTNIYFAIARAQSPLMFRVLFMFDFSLSFYLELLKNCYSVFALFHDSI